MTDEEWEEIAYAEARQAYYERLQEEREQEAWEMRERAYFE